MNAHPLFQVLRRSASGALLVLGMSQAGAASTSLEITGLLTDGFGNRITASPYMIFTEGIYDSPTGGTLLTSLGTEHVQVNDGFYLQVFGLDDALFASTAYLQVNLNGFDMAPRLGIFFNGSYYVANGITSGGPSGTPGVSLFQLYAGTATPPPIPEPGTDALMLGGLAFVGVWAARRRGARAA